MPSAGSTRRSPIPPFAVVAAAALLSLGASGAGAQVRPGIRPTTRPPGPDSATQAMTRPKQPAEAGTVDGIVTDTTLRPLDAAEVTVLRSAVKVNTEVSGRFRLLRMPVGEYIVIVRRVGFHPASLAIEVRANDTTRISYALEPLAQRLNAVTIQEQTVAMRMMPFEERRKFGLGQFMTNDEIVKHNTVTGSELLRRFRGLTLSPISSGGGFHYLVRANRGAGGFSGDCNATVVVDDVIMPLPFDSDMLPPARDIAGIEWYVGPSETPPEFNALGSNCGVLIIWTRSGP